MVGPGRNVTLIEELLLYLEKDPTTPSWATSPSESVSQRNIKVAFSIEGASRYINRVTLHNRNSNSLSSAIASQSEERDGNWDAVCARGANDLLSINLIGFNIPLIPLNSHSVRIFPLTGCCSAAFHRFWATAID